MSKNKSIITAAMTAALCIGVLYSGAYSADMRDISTMALVKDMGLGINLGNTFESNDDPEDWNGWEDHRWINGTTVDAYETAWGSPIVTKAMIDGYKNAGFKTVRIPVSWTNLMSDTAWGTGSYTISPDLLARVEEVVDWVLEDDMYAIVNLHHQKWWIQRYFPTDSAECMRKYTRIWEQVCAKFKDKSDYLILESMNEEGSWNDVWNRWRNSGDKARAYGFLNTINQTFVNIVRASGGNNGERHLLLAGFDTNIDYTSDPMFVMPTDPKNRCAVSVHYYDPAGFTLVDKDEDWAKLMMTWGTAADSAELRNKMNKLKTNFVDQNIPVIVGEYGAASKPYRGAEQIRKYTLAVAKAIYDRDMCPVLWDIQWNPDNGEDIFYYNRKSAPPAFADPQFVAGIKELGGDGTAIRYTPGASKSVARSMPIVTIIGKKLTVNAPSESKVRIRVVNLTGKTVAAFKSTGAASFSLRKIPAGAYLVEAIRDGHKATSAVTLR
jgi:endoglucanase